MRQLQITSWFIAALVICFIVDARAFSAVEPQTLTDLMRQASRLEEAHEWEKACDAYENLLRMDRKLSDARLRLQICLRRYWQIRRFHDVSYQREVLSLDFGETVKLYDTIHQSILESTTASNDIEPAQIFKKGLEEFDNALLEPYFLERAELRDRPNEVRAFRRYLEDLRASPPSDAAQSMKVTREIALNAQARLGLNANSVIMEFACGACHAIDDYTTYLTPDELRDLTGALRGAAGDTFVASVTLQVLNEGVGYLKITRFQESTAHEVDEALSLASRSAAKGMILDLRGNRGGIFESAISVARAFLSTGVITSTRNTDPRLNMIYQSRNSSALSLPLLVLIDADTASAAEVLAGALKDNHRAFVIGQPSFGKGCTQAVIRLPDGLGGVPTGGLCLTVAQFFTPAGLPYGGNGITPDRLVEAVPSEDPMDDPALSIAIDTLLQQWSAAR